MVKTKSSEVFRSFESEFQDKHIIPESLEYEWFLKAVARYSVELDRLNFNEDTLEFDTKLDRYVIDTLAAYMKQSYQEREVSRINKQISIVGKDISIDGNNGSKTAAREELAYVRSKAKEMTANQMETAYV